MFRSDVMNKDNEKKVIVEHYKHTAHDLDIGWNQVLWRRFFMEQCNSLFRPKSSFELLSPGTFLALIQWTQIFEKIFPICLWPDTGSGIIAGLSLRKPKLQEPFITPATQQNDIFHWFWQKDTRDVLREGIKNHKKSGLWHFFRGKN